MNSHSLSAHKNNYKSQNDYRGQIVCLMGMKPVIKYTQGKTSAGNIIILEYFHNFNGLNIAYILYIIKSFLAILIKIIIKKLHIVFICGIIIKIEHIILTFKKICTFITNFDLLISEFYLFCCRQGYSNETVF